MVKKIGIALAVAVVLVLNLALLKPNSFRVARSVSIQASAEKIFPLLNDLHAQNTWSPWDKKDPGMKRSFSGPAQGVGAFYAWDGNREIGAELHIQEKTVKHYMTIILSKLHARNRVEAALIAQNAWRAK